MYPFRSLTNSATFPVLAVLSNKVEHTDITFLEFQMCMGTDELSASHQFTLSGATFDRPCALTRRSGSDFCLHKHCDNAKPFLFFMVQMVLLPGQDCQKSRENNQRQWGRSGRRCLSASTEKKKKIPIPLRLSHPSSITHHPLYPQLKKYLYCKR